MRTLCLVSALICCLPMLPSAHAQTAATARPRLMLLEIRINQGLPAMARVAQAPGGPLLFGRDDLRAWRIRPPGDAAEVVDGVPFDDLGRIEGARIDFDERRQAVEVQLPASAFVTGQLSAASAESPPISPSTFGAFLNYDLALQRSAGRSTASGWLGATVSDSWGMVTNSVLAGTSDGGIRNGAVRLESTYRFDDPSSLTRFTLGDTVNQGAAWSTPFRFGGVQIGTNFGLRPGYISYPTPTLRGGAALPSAVEVYVNDTLRYQGQLDPGPFALGNVPVLTGAGEMKFTVTDPLGVGRTVSTPYYVSSALLKPGSTDYSVDLGWTRRNYGLRSFDYGPPFATGNWRHGVDETTTVEVRGESSERLQVAGAGATWVWSPVGEFTLHGALSRSEARGSGRLARASFSRLGPDWSFSASRQVASAGFEQVAWQDDAGHVQSQSQLFAGRALGNGGSVGVGYTALRYDRGDAVRLVSASYTVAIGRSALLGAFVARSRSTRQNATLLGLTLTVPLGDRQSASLSVQQQAGRATALAEINQALPSDEGWGWRVSDARGDIERSQALVTWRSRFATLSAEAANDRGRGAARLLASGTVGYAGGMGFALQQPSDAFAIVDVDGAADLTVYKENQPWTRTDAKGRAVVSGLRPYEANRISIDSTQLSIATQVKRDAMTIVPRQGGFAMATLAVANVQSATVSAMLPDGQALPAGTEVRGTTRAFSAVTGFAGIVLIAQPAADEAFEAHWRGRACGFLLPAVPTAGTLPHLGAVRCEATPAPAAAR